MTDSNGSDSDEQAAPKSGVLHSDGDKVVIVTQDGMGVAHTPSAADPANRDDGDPVGDDGASDDESAVAEDSVPKSPTDLVEQPAKVMRIGSMVKSLLEEVRNAPLDDAGRSHLAQVHARSIAELKNGLAPELVEELDRIALPFSDDNPSDAELRIAQAQLVGWLEGLFHGIQTALVAQQMAAQAQLQQMRQLPPGVHPNVPGMPGQAGPGSDTKSGDKSGHEGTGQYL